MKRIVLCITVAVTVLLLLPQTAVASPDNQDMDSVERPAFGMGAFKSLDLGFGPRCKSLGGCTALSTDYTAVYWNPASLAEDRTTLGASGTDRFGEAIYHGFLGGLTPTPIAAFGAGVSYQVIPDIPVVFSSDPKFRETITDTEAVGFFGAGKAFSFGEARLKAGATGKFYFHHISGENSASGHGVGFDFGAQYQAGRITLGATAKDVTNTKINWGAGATDQRSRQWRFGASYIDGFFTLTSEMRLRNQSLKRASAGIEAVTGPAELRGSLIRQEGSISWRLGFGLNIDKFSFDFVYVPDPDLGASYVGAVNYQF